MSRLISTFLLFCLTLSACRQSENKNPETTFKINSDIKKDAEKHIETDDTPLPSKDRMKFYFLTNKGKFVGQEEVKNFDNNSSQWLGLFEDGNKLITEIRMVSDMK